MIIPPLPTPSPVNQNIGTDPLGFETQRQAAEPDAALAKDEEAAIKEHLADVRGFSDAVKQAKAIEAVPVLGDMADMSMPIPDNLAEDGLMPLETPEAWQARGYMDPAGNVTPSGEYYFMMEDAGLFDQKGQLTDKGKAFSMDPVMATMEPFKKEFIIRDKAGLNEKADITFGDAAGSAWQFVKDAAWGTGRLLKKATGGDALADFLDTDAEKAEREAEVILTGQSFLEGSLESTAGLAMGATAIRDKTLANLTGNEAAYYDAKQKYARSKFLLESMDIADHIGTITDSEELVASIETSRELATMQLGEQKAAEIKRSGEAAGALVGDPTNLAAMGVGAAVGAGLKIPGLARLSKGVEETAQAAMRAEDAAAAVAKARAVHDKTTRAVQVAMNQADNLRNLGRAEGAAKAEAIAGRLAGTATEVGQKLPAMEARAMEAQAHAAKLAERFGGAQKVAQAFEATMEAGRQLRALPARAVAPVLETIGDRIIKSDTALDAALTRMGLTEQIRSKASQVAGFVTGGAIAGPWGAVIGAQIPNAIKSTLAAGPLIRGVGNFSRVVGQELMQARSSVPFWRRVSQNAAISPAGRATSHLLDNFTLSGKVFTPIRIAGQAAKGVAAAAPVDIAFEILAEGGDTSASTFKQALAESLVFAGPASVGGALVRGDVGSLRARAAGDEVNLRGRLDPESLRQFSRLPKGARKFVAIHAGTNPAANWRFVTEGSNSHDPRTNTITINTAAPDIRPIVAHEVNHYIQAKAQMSEGITAMLVGNEVTGGLLRSADGTLAPDFAAAMDEYNGRLARSGVAPLTVEEFALEYFTEATVDDMLTATDSGAVQRAAGKSDLERMVKGIAGQIVQKTPILKDMFFRTGGALDGQGQMVQGNGLLADGIRELPGAKKLLRDMLDITSGRRETKISDEAPVSIPMAMAKGNKPLLDAMFSTLQTDEAGNAILDKDGVPTEITSDTDKQRSAAGLIIAEEQAERIERGQELPPGEIKPTDKGTFEGTHVPVSVFTKMKGIFNAKQMATWRMLNQAAKDFTGETFNVIYQPALKTTKKGRKVYDGIKATFREVVPVGVSTTKAGNILIHFFSVTKFVENIQKRAKSARGKALYKSDEIAIREDAEAVMNLHREGKTTDKYFADKYGEIEGIERKNFINTVFGLMTKEQRVINPLFDADKLDLRDGVYRTYRLDRINQTTRLQGRKSLPFMYDNVKLNHFPNGIPEAFHGTPHKVDRFSAEKIGTGEGNQAYGHGLYFADSKELGEFYRDKLGRTVTVGGERINYENPTHLAAYHQSPEGRKYLSDRAAFESPNNPIHQRALDILSQGGPLPKVKVSEGNLYGVSLKPKPEELLDWDEPVARQSPQVRDALLRVYPELNGRDTSQVFVRPQGAEQSAKLLEAGIRGVRYLDGNSRNKGAGSRNYVIFDDADVEIITENGKPVK